MNTDDMNLLHKIFLNPVAIQSNIAREKAKEIGALASGGFITTAVSPDLHGKKWRVTAAGYLLLKVEKYL